MNHSPYKYCARGEKEWVHRLGRALKSLHLDTEEQFQQQVSRIGLPPTDDEEIDYLFGLDSDSEVSSDGVDVSSSADSTSRPSTPGTELSSSASSQLDSAPQKPWVGVEMYDGLIQAAQPIQQPHEVIGSTSTDDANMTNAGENLPVASSGDIQDTTNAGEDLIATSSSDNTMQTATEILLMSSMDDEAMSDIAEVLEAQPTEDVEMGLTHSDGSNVGPLLQGHSQEIVMEGSLTTANSSPDATLGVNKIEGVHSTTVTSSPITLHPVQHQQQGLTRSEKVAPTSLTLAEDLNIGVWKEMKALGPDFHTDLRKILDSSVADEMPDLHSEVLKLIRTVGHSIGLVRLMKWQHSQDRFSIKQAYKLGDCVAKFREAAVASANATSPDSFQWFATPSEVPVTLSPANSSLVSTTIAQDGHERVQFDAQTEQIVVLLVLAHHHLLNKGFDAHFLHMFQLPLHNKVEMETIVDYVRRAKDWGSGSLDVAKVKLQEMCSRDDFDAASFIWNCNTVLHASKLRLRGSEVSYQKARTMPLRDIFHRLKANNYMLAKDGQVTSCMTWDEMRELAEREEHDFFALRAGKTKSILKHVYEKHIAERRTYWAETDNVRRHIATLHPTPSTVPVLEDASTLAPTRSSHKRDRNAFGYECLWTPQAKTVKHTHDSEVAPEQANDEQDETEQHVSSRPVKRNIDELGDNENDNNRSSSTSPPPRVIKRARGTISLWDD